MERQRKLQSLLCQGLLATSAMECTRTISQLRAEIAESYTVLFNEQINEGMKW